VLYVLAAGVGAFIMLIGVLFGALLVDQSKTSITVRKDPQK
jgi:hypothetical protein